MVLFTLIVVAAVSCTSTTTPPPQIPNASSQSGNSNPVSAPASPQITGSQRLQHAWTKALEGLAMGGTIAGPYGAGGGLVIGLVAGLIMAESHYTAINGQIQAEHQKDRQLEAALEQELARQRELEKQIAGVNGQATETAPNQSSGGVAAATEPAENPRPAEMVASLTKPASQAPPFRNVEVRDINGDNVPDVWVYYHPQKPGEIVRQEEATKNDGRVNVWSYFKDGALVRRELDTRDHGRADTVFYYVKDKVAREERDETGEGRMTYRATYADGRLARVERETNGSGRTDLWVYYDTTRETEVVIKEEKDLNGDGAVDLWSHYDNGRLVRRDVSAVGLEILFKEESLATAEAQQVAPGS
jgi:hypothetical protein